MAQRRRILSRKQCGGGNGGWRRNVAKWLAAGVISGWRRIHASHGGGQCRRRRWHLRITASSAAASGYLVWLASENRRIGAAAAAIGIGGAPMALDGVSVA